ncbi:AAA family ATPase [Candidatus Parabeggiatoa sp. HSG14]|uniref:AAA family ATPase n=1 Tax=Candidatus Parabeggiatoa sp. HSG14 TaxID=3055593 RepID=UPI0025A8F573|nr:AAA family ATPase [Thiotrichales bacterium HSG14]
MNVYFERLGVIKKGEIELNDLTILCGPNNTAKTYVMYSLYGLLDKDFEVHFDFVKDIVHELVQKNVYKLDLHDIMGQHFDNIVKHVEDSFHKQLPNLFGVEESEFAKTKIKLAFESNNLLQRAKKKSWETKLSLGKDKDWFLYIEKAADQTMVNLTLRQEDIPHRFLTAVISSHIVKSIFSNISRRCFLLPAERAALNLFSGELSSIRNQLLHHAQKDNINPMEVLRDITESRYAVPISDYIEFLNKKNALKKHKGDFAKIAQNVQKNILKGKYMVDNDGGIYFLPYRSNNKNLPLHFTSSTVKSLFGLVFYLNHVARKGDCLMIDEPELSLHLDNQRIVARILAQLVNAGLKVVVSTHSSHFVRELNNLIMLNQSFSQIDTLRKRHGYMKTDVLDSKHVSAYLFDNKTISLMELDPNEGIIAETFDKTINSLNQSSNDIYYAIQDELEEE